MSLDDLNEVDESLKNEEIKPKYIQRLSLIGGISARDCTRKVIERVMSNEVMAKYNMKGNKGKLSFLSTTLCSAVKVSILKAFPTSSEHDIYIMIGTVLKYAPDRRGGGGRRQSAASTDPLK